MLAGGKITAQNFYLKIAGSNSQETKVIDSITYIKKHQNVKSVFNESNIVNEKLINAGYIDCKTASHRIENDSIYAFTFDLGEPINYARIYIGVDLQKNIPEYYPLKNDTVTLPYHQTSAFLEAVLRKCESDGFATTKVKLTHIEKRKKQLVADLEISQELKRNLNDIVINGYDKFPAGHKKNILRLYRNKTFNQRNLEKINTDFEKFRFVKQIKYPEILFTKDSTKVFVYLEKAKANTFDGYIGLTNDDNKNTVVSGYVDLVLNNTLNSGERFSLYWKSDGQNQRTFNLAVDVPYIFKSPIGIKTELNIFKQDSTFQNTRTALDVGYFFNYNTRLYLGYQSTESSDIQNTNSTVLSDFENTFLTTTFEYTDFKTDDLLFPEKTNSSIKLGTGSRKTTLITDTQFFVSLNIKHNFYLNPNNIISIKSQNSYLKSNNYITNELYRFGGINSIRGFNENSLQGNLFTSILTEYRYVLSPTVYVHSVVDYALLQDRTLNSDESLLGLGLGLGFLSKNGLFNLVYANGSTKNQTVKLSNSIVQLSLKAYF